MSEKSGYFWDITKFSGVRAGEAPRQRHTQSGEKAIEQGELRKYSGDMGRVVERVLGQLWTVDPGIPFNNPDLEPAFSDVQSAVSTEGMGIFSHNHLHNLYTWQLLGTPLGGVFAELAKTLDQKYGTNFSPEYTTFVNGTATNETCLRYLVDAALVIAAETIQPSLFNELVFVPGIGIGQLKFDGVLIDPENYRPDLPLEEVLQKNITWGVVDIKLAFRSSLVSRVSRMTKPEVWHERSIQNTLGKLFLKTQQRTENFVLPEFVEFRYMRGARRNEFIRLMLDNNYIALWVEILEIDMLSGKYKGRERQQAEAIFEFLTSTL